MNKIFKIGGFIAIVVVIFAAIIASTTNKPANSELVWDEQMTIGNIDAKNYFIIYSDLVCPYCVAFENAIVEHEEEFQEYIKENDILVEIRLSDFLYEYGETNPIHSRYSAVATYCAKDEGKFWDYYNKAITTVWNDYFKSAGKSAFTELNKNDESYWIEIGKSVGLGDDFESCVKNEEPLPTIVEFAAKSAKFAGGLPAFKFNSFVPKAGFNLDWGWDYVLAYFEEGLKN